MRKLEFLGIIGIISLFCGATAISSAAQTFNTVANFDFTNGSAPNAALIQGTDGNFYGTTLLGGSSDSCTDGCGTVFKVTPSGTLTTLHNFDGTDGSSATGVIQGTDGNFYGTTANGGASNICSNGCGTVFKITQSGTLTTLHNFNGTDGSGPYTGLIQGSDGNFYGTTAYGGTNDNCTNGCGTVFKITASGTLTTLYSFDVAHGSGPNALVQGTDGNFYGTTFSGGTLSNGLVFKITAKGTLTILHSFEGSDGSGPSSGLIQATDGNFYGATYEGGPTGNGDGTIYKITAKGTLTTLHSFDYADGDAPAGLVQATDGNFYGTTQDGGNAFFGTVFQMTAKSALTTLHNFDDYDGADPQSAPMQATNGNFYGTAAMAGSGGYGAVFSLSMGIGPFVETNPASGKVGTAVTILGNNLAGATSVTFHGKKATFKASSTYITTTVPSGATTGTVEVVTPNNTLKSKMAFRVP